MTKTYTERERRKYPRANEEVPLLYRAAEDTSLNHLSEVRDSTTKNISGGGVCFEAEVYAPPEAVLEIQINKPIDGGLEATLPIHTNAKVIWIKQIETGKYKLGLQFVDIMERYQEEIVRNVAGKLKRRKDATKT